MVCCQAPDRKDLDNAMAPEGVSVDEKPDLGPREFGPQAVFMSGKLGNYEPPVVKQHGPGERFIQYSVCIAGTQKLVVIISFVCKVETVLLCHCRGHC